LRHPPFEKTVSLSVDTTNWGLSMRNYLLIGILALPLSAALQTETPLTNAEVVKVWKAGLGDENILAKIDGAGRAAFALDTDDPIELKKSGVSRAVMSEMPRKASERSGGTGAGSAPGAGPQRHTLDSSQQDDDPPSLERSDGTRDNPRYYSGAGHTVAYNAAKEQSNAIARI
jgi:hypothetical protein